MGMNMKIKSGVTNELLDRHPVSCGNCLQMKIVGRRNHSRVAKCWRGWLDDRVYVIDSTQKGVLPGNWDKAKTCPDFDSMIIPQSKSWAVIGDKFLGKFGGEVKHVS